ncbi:canalicular multispecific organic anion transporter 1 [Aplysia californica]|uniref:Canalicular multispecific organic anion transporter 1 n=1 Tax=Aplysia californica TaxID=6500 RepID=A0ABM0K845_APLCA|nr:canalicular multispecific organic anion transporter 1 [Aplysia californica]
MASISPKGESFKSRLLFQWCERAYGESERRSGQLVEQELFDLPSDLKAVKWRRRLEASWKTVLESQRAQYTSVDPGPDDELITENSSEEQKEDTHGIRWLFSSVLFRTVWRVYKGLFFQVLTFLILGRICAMIAKPFLMTQLIQFLSEGSPFALSSGIPIFLLMMMFLFLSSLAQEWSFYVTSMAEIAIGSGVGNMVFAKVLRLSSAERRKFTIGEINNILTSTVPKMANNLSATAYAFTSVFNLLGNCIFLYVYAGWFSVLVIGLMGVSVWVSGSVEKKQEQVSLEKSEAQNRKMTLLTQMFRGIRVIKLHAWEKVFGRRLEAAVDEELKLGRREILLYLVSAVMWDIVPMLAIALLLLCHLQIGDVTTFLRPDSIFGVVVVINDMRFFLGEMTLLYSLLYLVKNSVRKIEPLLLATEIHLEEGLISLQSNEPVADTTAPDENSGGTCSENVQDCALSCIQEFDFEHRYNEAAIIPKKALQFKDRTVIYPHTDPISMSNATFIWDKRKRIDFSLRDFTVNIRRGRFVAVVGKVASGKSSFLAAILGEMERVSGVVRTTGTIAYVPQEAWLMNDSIRANILFGQTLDPPRYKRVLEVCALDKDLTQFPSFDDTLLGEKGVNISGGQKQRISLARAAYSGADLILLDDPLSAVDAEVGEHIFKSLLGPSGLLSDTTRVMVTHGVQWLRGVDSVLLLQLAPDGTANIKELPGGAASIDGFHTNEVCEDDREQQQQQLKMTIYGDFDARGYTWLENEDSLKKPIEEISRNENTDDDAELLSISSLECLFAYLKFFGKGSGLALVLLRLVCAAIFALPGLSLQAWSDDLNGTEVTHCKIAQHQKNAGSSNCSAADELKYSVENESDVRVWNISLYYLSVFLSGTGALFLVLVAYQLLLAHSVFHCTRKMSQCLQWSVFRSPLAFFETNSIGKIALRFGHDVNEIGHDVPVKIEYVTVGFLNVAISLSVVCFACSETSLLLLLFIPFMYQTIKKYINVTGSVQNLIKKYEDFQYSKAFEAVEGSEVIRAFGHTDRFIASYEQATDKCNKIHFNRNAQSRWMSSRLLLSSSVFTALCALVTALCAPESTLGSTVGLVITYALEVGHNAFFFGLLLNSAAKSLTSIARLTKYLSLPSEAAWKIEDEGGPSKWPTHGKVVYRNLCVAYGVHNSAKSDDNWDCNDMNMVLKDVSFTVMPGEKIGVVGRTGAGKTTLLLSLFRLVEARSGSVYIDDIDISTLGLHELRSKVAIIPQDPVLFTGTLRSNLDPEGCSSDDDIWTCLQHVGMEKSVSSLPGGLDFECSEGGAGMSLGQRQLLCMARTLMRKCRILVLDEATSSVDCDTDRLLQSTLRHEFSSCTVFTIAHRIDTVLDYDRILVLDSGKIVEFDSPAQLCNNPGSFLRKLREQSTG